MEIARRRYVQKLLERKDNGLVKVVTGYIQSAFEMLSPEKIEQEKKSLNKLNDSFKKFVIIKEDIKTSIDENGLITMGIYDFLLNEDSLEI